MIARKTGALILGAGVLLSACGKSPSSTVQDFYYALEKNDIDAALGYVEPSVRVLWGSKLVSLLRNGVSHIENCGGIRGIDTKELSNKNNSARIFVSISYKNKENPGCQERQRNFQLVKSGGDWKIISFGP